MPKYYCDYCDKFLTHDSPSVRKTHCTGRTHKNSVREYYQKWLEEQVQKLVDHASEAYKQGKVPPPMFGAAMGIPPPGIPGPGILPPLGMKPLPPGGPMPPTWTPGAGGMPSVPVGGAPMPSANMPTPGMPPMMPAPGVPQIGPAP
ncbi:unnamed protein product [Schistocephalus solidus]|uniref:U1 small nuclear ribonucleoprotein C n=1 Tax=Schistocephalus solidus TaxID=70667 RepID=A0A183TLK6_SCHSO|nr:unnamed protein product [Schistocephalus solidus]